MFLRVPSAARYSCYRACCVSMLCVLYVPCLPWLGARQLRFAVDGGLDSGVGHIGCSDMLYEQFNGFPGGISALSLFHPRMVRCHWCVNFVWPNVGDGVALGCYMVCLCFFPWVFLSSRVSLSCDHGLDYASQCENNNNKNNFGTGTKGVVYVRFVHYSPGTHPRRQQYYAPSRTVSPFWQNW